MTRVSQSIVIVDGDVEDIVHDTRNGANLISFGSTLSLCLDGAPQDVLDKLAVATAAAAAENRTRQLKAVA
ncbi:MULTISPECIES: hypothetical protein [unclassified Streptomyces]|uniref:hypothetical protein n=1 Tax=unclassified Streptomyces TaxID=2593676 RepID=UPI00278BCBF4|nr:MULTISPECIES: hypothetical protein [unclassified Streptomyces]